MTAREIPKALRFACSDGAGDAGQNAVSTRSRTGIGLPMAIDGDGDGSQGECDRSEQYRLAPTVPFPSAASSKRLQDGVCQPSGMSCDRQLHGHNRELGRSAFHPPSEDRQCLYGMQGRTVWEFEDPANGPDFRSQSFDLVLMSDLGDHETQSARDR